MTKFWLNDPNVLLDRNHITEIFPDKNFSLAQKLNAITRLVIVMTILGYLFTRSVKILVSAAITLVIVVIMFKTKSQKEPFSEFKKEDLTIQTRNKK